MTDGDAAYWQARAESLERERDEARKYGRKWHTVAIAAMLVLRRTQDLLLKEAPALVDPFREIIQRQDGIGAMFGFVETALTVARLLVMEVGTIRSHNERGATWLQKLKTAYMLNFDFTPAAEAQHSTPGPTDGSRRRSR